MTKEAEYKKTACQRIAEANGLPIRWEAVRRAERRRRITCDQCQIIRINGRVCHEIGCPQARKDRR